MRPIVPFLIATALASAQGSDLKPPPEKSAKGFATIKHEDCKEWLYFLAGPECEGRGTGQAGYQKAADFVAGKFKEWGLAPVADGGEAGTKSYFQMVPFVADAIDAQSVVDSFTAGKEQIALKVGEGFGLGGTGSLDVKDAGVVFVVAASNEKKLPEFDVAGKVVIAISLAPESGFASDIRWLTKLNEAKPAAVVRIDDVRAAAGVADGDWRREDQASPPSNGQAGGRRSRPLNVFVSKDVASKLATAGGLDLEKLAAEVRKSEQPKKTASTLKASLKAGSARTKKGVPNVIGYLEGSDPTLKKELVIIGSHLDHLGRGRDGQIYPGADDDGSGSTALLAIARAAALNGQRPKRSLLFIAMAAEEMGLLGSEWYVEHPIFPLADTVAELQLDMVGRWEEAHPSENPGDEKAEDNKNSLHLVGAKKISSQLHDIVIKLNADHIGFDFEYDGEKYYTRSDHYNFAKKGVPVTFMFTGVHRDYHMTTDTPDKIDYPKLARVAQLNYLLAWELADRKDRLVKDVKPAKPKKGE